jgi:hypothetical protein
MGSACNTKLGNKKGTKVLAGKPKEKITSEIYVQMWGQY